MPEFNTPPRASRPLAGGIAAILWAVVLAVLLLRAGLHPHRPTSLTTYLAGGEAWNELQPVYTNWRGFVYPPVVAWFFSLLNHLPLALDAILWRLLTAGVFLLGIESLLRSGIFHRIPSSSHGLIYLGLLPLSIGNLDNAQANPLIAGLMMLSVAAFQWEAWNLCALAIGIAITFKIYPVALALLLCLLRPRRLSWRILIWLLIPAIIPFAVQNPHYAAAQYHAWLQGRMGDNRFEYPMKDAPLDLWYLLVRVGRLPVSERAYTALQVICGAAIAALVLLQSRRRLPQRDILANLFLMVSAWMLLLGPATENQTYVVLAPAACLAAVQSLTCSSCRTRLFALSAVTLLLAAVGRNSLFPHIKSPVEMTIQPIAALLLLAAIVMELRITSEIDPGMTSVPTPGGPR